jgi:hypothetical protein
MTGAARRLLSAAIAALVALHVHGCGGSLTEAQLTDLRRQLRDAMAVSVETRAERDEQSKLLADIVGKGALDGLNQEQLRAALGTGQACRTELCAKQGFSESDWYYEIGIANGDEVKQLPVLIVGFDPRGRVARVYTLTTH